jgi:tape measure domain-containing protein
VAEGLDWLLELDAKLDGALKMVRALDQNDAALHKVDASLRKVERSTKATDGGVVRLGATVGRASSMMTGLAAGIGAAAGTLAGLATGRMVGMFIDLTGSMLASAAAAERTEKSFKLLLGVEGGEATLEWIDQIAKHTEFTGDELKGLAGDMARVGFKGEGLQRALAASLDMAAFSGSGSAGAASAASALEKVFLTGKADPKALRSLGFKEEDFLAELSGRTGIGIERLKKQLDAGKIDTEESLEALFSMITKKTGKDLGGAGVEMSKTLNARLKHLRDVPDNLFQSIVRSGGFSKISDFVGKLADAFDPASPLGSRLTAALGSLVDTIGNVLGGINIEDLAGKIERGIVFITSSVQPAIAVFKEFWEIAKGLVGAVGKVIDVAHKFTPLGFIADRIGDNAAAKAGLNTSALGERAVGDGAAMRAQLRARGGPIGVSVAEGMTMGVKTELGIHSPSRVFQDIGRSTAQGLTLGIDRNIAHADDAISSAFAPSSPGVSSPVAGMGGGAVINLGGIHVSVSGGRGAGDDKQLADTIAQRIEEIAPGALQSAFERLAIQAGGAA